MSKSILLPIHPEWCEKIFSGEKTIEVRKTKPKLQTPFKCYVYCTKGINLWQKYNAAFTDGRFDHLRYCFDYILNGKVIGEFVVDEIEPKYCANGIAAYYENEQGTCLSDNELRMYADGVKPLYFWHITDAKLYDKPRELRDFYVQCNPQNSKCSRCSKGANLDDFDYMADGYKTVNNCDCLQPLTRPPQSFCYVEELYNV